MKPPKKEREFKKEGLKQKRSSKNKPPKKRVKKGGFTKGFNVSF
ncbi:hypothetical protein HPHPH29_1387 [Helicobacter pylori Hp H-29]|nr:hypothetical protein HPHPH29_1387 [Helicobacter pylori Hp H-29]